MSDDDDGDDNGGDNGGNNGNGVIGRLGTLGITREGRSQSERGSLAAPSESNELQDPYVYRELHPVVTGEHSHPSLLHKVFV